MVVIIQVASHTCARGIIVISVMAGRTLIGNQGMSPVERIIVIMDIKGRWIPVWGRGVT